MNPKVCILTNALNWWKRTLWDLESGSFLSPVSWGWQWLPGLWGPTGTESWERPPPGDIPFSCSSGVAPSLFAAYSMPPDSLALCIWIFCFCTCLIIIQPKSILWMLTTSAARPGCRVTSDWDVAAGLKAQEEQTPNMRTECSSILCRVAPWKPREHRRIGRADQGRFLGRSDV